MFTGLMHLHRTIAYAALILIFVAMMKALFGFLNKKEFTEGDRKLGLFALISAHLQLVFGLVLLVMIFVTQRYGEIGNIMKDAHLRFEVIEHPLMMIIGVVFITLGYVKAKKGTDSRSRFKAMAMFFLLGFIAIISRVPWDKII